MPVPLKVRLATSPNLADSNNPDVHIYIDVEGEDTILLSTPWSLLFMKEHESFFPDPPPITECICGLQVKVGSRKHRKHLSKKQERRVAEGVGGRAQCGSGALPGNKGDGRVYGRLRIENKFTTKKSYSVKRSDLDKIRAECQGRETPVFQIDFRDPTFNRLEDSWVLIPEQVWRKLIRDTSDDS